MDRQSLKGRTNIAFAAAIVAATVAISAASTTPAFAQLESRFGAARVTYDAKSDRYCFRDTTRGPGIAATQCKSKAQWAQDGLTIRHIKPAVQLARR